MANVNPDLRKERENGTFSVEKLTNLLDGGKHVTDRRRHVERLALNEFSKGEDYNFMSRKERYISALHKTERALRCCKEYGLTKPDEVYWLWQLAFPHEASPIQLHGDMFLPTLTRQGTEEQVNKYLPLAEKYQIIGTYAQTEMGHGTFIRGLETTATYDPQTEEFILHSPTLTSLKWWPGGLGKTSNYAIVMALLYTNGKNYGMHPFMVQLRSHETHEPLPGITIGDIGPKFGFDTIDNGFVQFDHFRIPREDMLMKYSQVLKDGTYVKSTKLKKSSYGVMVLVRSMLIYYLAIQGLAPACTIAIRYSAVRRQSEQTKSQLEPQILDYQTQQYKLFPILASAYAVLFTGVKMKEIYYEVDNEIQQGHTERLPELHALSSGLKALTSSMASWCIERCRLACGGHGYSAASGFPKIYVAVTAACTYEGENTVMLLQCARYLIKTYQGASNGKKLSGSVSYLSDKVNSRSTITSEFSLKSLVDAFKHRAFRFQACGSDPEDSWNRNSVVLTKAAEAHCYYYMVSVFESVVEAVEDDAVKRVVGQLCQLFALFAIHENAGDFVQDGFISNDQMELVKWKELSLLSDIRRNAVLLVDAFDFHDEFIGSILGRFDGNVYANLFEWAKSSPLNKPEVQESYIKYLQPLLNPNKSKL
ncbi:hypothetical protein LSH36_188g07009 [Paralvinella palmiformis]|uniref:Acyl-coenzyme A oxidase n=1 Tax=Paralvinella palmiformis TaxID=53620 RepID=A0AAD9JS47_9ANNE|nr:hypothetical protein LSH36_188g07009 [Paralvinella palmiformis]